MKVFQLIVAALFIATTPAFGDTVPDILRILLREGAVQMAPDNVAFMKSTPGFVDLINEIANSDPEFAMGVWLDLAKTNIWISTSAIPLLPGNQTAILTQDANVQIAIREKNDILISRPVFEQTAQAYVLLHEAFHGQGVSGPLQHERIRAAVRLIHDSRGHFPEGVKFRQQFESLEINPSIRLSQNNGQAENLNRMGPTAMALLLSGVGTQEQRCQLLRGLNQLDAGYIGYSSLFTAGFPELTACASPSAKIQSNQAAAKIITFTEKYLDGSSPLLYVSPYANGLIKEIGEIYLFRKQNSYATELNQSILDQCQKYAIPAIANEFGEVDAALKELTRIASTMNALLRGATESITKAEKVEAVALAFQLHEPENILFRDQKSIDDFAPTMSARLRVNLANNIKACSKAFGKNYLSRKKL